MTFCFPGRQNRPAGENVSADKKVVATTSGGYSIAAIVTEWHAEWFDWR